MFGGYKFLLNRLRVTQKGLLVTLKRLSSKDWTHPKCPPDILIEPLSTPIRGISLLPVAVTS